MAGQRAHDSGHLQEMIVVGKRGHLASPEAARTEQRVACEELEDQQPETPRS